ncbi:DNA-3-methyladenine glycosylase 2 family protein [Pseudomonas sp. MPFS]|uniref:DNA-3-methyladenine glycosylase family protein n=1 Tax=Pseudomonas sp. MPFS TaxID=2795724 RepID=UPI001F130DDF|nr:AlkA N-terminal domain-containing protein [Pseudomonas sp. MPFS]UMZ15369.1 DNA-3-methyladenine glycosylase 2 family protein [Pseudomonas sp. MPFS]
MRLLLPYAGPYDWQAMLGFLARRAIAGLEVVQGEAYARSFELDGQSGTLSVRPGPGEQLDVRFQSAGQDLSPQLIGQVVMRVRRQFDLDADLQRIARELAMDELLQPLLRSRPGLRVPGAWDGFELAIRAVLGQQITVQGAIDLAGRLVALHGRPLACGDPLWPGLSHVFATPTALASADLAALGMPRSRARTLSGVAQALLDDPLLLEPKGSLQQGVQGLLQLSGIGDWTAHYIALRHMREMDAFPAADVGLLNAMATLQGQRPNARQLLARAEAWRPWRGYAAQHLWAAGG